MLLLKLQSTFKGMHEYVK